MIGGICPPEVVPGSRGNPTMQSEVLNLRSAGRYLGVPLTGTRIMFDFGVAITFFVIVESKKIANANGIVFYEYNGV